MNTKLLLKVKAAILAEPMKFDISSWFEESDSSPCGTTACIAGHTIAISRRWKKLKEGLKIGLRFVGDEGQRLLELDYDQRLTLFNKEEWPEKYIDGYNHAKTAKGRARVTANFIDWFIKTNKAE